MPARKKEPEDLTAKKELALEVIDRLKRNIRMPAAHWTTITHGSCWSACGWRPSARTPG